MFGFVFSFAILYSFFAILYEAYTYNKYQGIGYLFNAFIIAIFEMIFYQPLNMLFSLSGNIDFFFSKEKKGWGEMTRKGFGSKQS